jgi:mevalonate kinase
MSQAKSRVSFNIPGKTFLLGEYVALFGGPSLVAATGPHFEVDFVEGEEEHPFHPKSPAGKYIAHHSSFFKKFSIEFHDPLQGQGGFGASTAQFIAVCSFHKKYEDICAERPFNFKNPVLALDIWHEYRALFASDEIPPSGADLIAQLVGGISSFRIDTMEWEKMEWPFHGTGLQLFKTPFKVNTHEHLAVLDKNNLPLTELKACVEKAIAGIKAENFDVFRDESRHFMILLDEAGLLSADARHEIERASKVPGVSLVRGCGALGADVLAVYGNPKEEFSILKKIASLPENLAYGTWMEVD